ncbi:helix-turn-helix domain-containing protein [Qipengyuania qiaonensis]|uniref:Helix-turn-helix domain-containing protein n=1 Tax=Qipengyuania qiaonensis TaxID=2867240 RepID=A0ABS7JBH8_9SPHN|nr:helix-turn-helix domain-containing protein [Qipengyuania qiaonensis]MBX7482367.1 helix-turn-helix domain-containing protein [Qipengyuania qiaonensis]
MKSATGSTPEGLPLAYNRAPCAALQPWVARIGVTSVVLPEGQTIECGTFGEQPILRMIYGSRWTAETADGSQVFEPGDRGIALYFGPCTRLMRLTAHGSFKVVSINFAPGGTIGLDLPPIQETLDRILPFDPFTRSPFPPEGFAPDNDARAWLDAAERELLDISSGDTRAPPDPLLAEFEQLCLTDPGAPLVDFAKSRGIARRTLERVIRKNWGVTPRFAMRRARALDMAAVLLNVIADEEEAEIRLRYFDQSHVTRELRKLLDTTPGRLQKGHHPLLLITMEIRQSRRLEVLARLASDDPRPWRDPHAEPHSLSRKES